MTDGIKQQKGGGEEILLKRGIKGWQVTMIGIGGVVGSLYFLGVGWCIEVMGPSIFFAFLLAAVIIYGLMIAYAELLVNVPRTGTFVAYSSEFLGPTISIGMSWSYWFNWVCYCPSEAIAVSYVLRALTGVDSPVAYCAFAIGTMIVLTIINIATVDIFARIESGLAITKIIVITVFALVGFGIWVGLWGHPDSTVLPAVEDGFKGMGINFGSGSLYNDLFPHGLAVALVMLVVVTANCQGTEMIGLAASESQNPDVSVPRACKSIVYRVIGLYLIPVLLVILIYPTSLGTDERPIFSDIAYAYGLPWMGKIFLAVVLVAAFSCANTGFYGTARCMYGMAIEGLAPKYLGTLSKNHAPKRAMLFTVAFMWMVLIIGLVSQMTGLLSSLYDLLLCLSGFTGTYVWVGIIASDISMRRRLRKRGYDPDTCLKAKVTKNMAWVPWFGMIAALGCMTTLAFGDVVDPEGNAGGGIVVFSIALSSIVIPMIVYRIGSKRGKMKATHVLKPGEKSFDELFPDKNV